MSNRLLPADPSAPEIPPADDPETFVFDPQNPAIQRMLKRGVPVERLRDADKEE